MKWEKKGLIYCPDGSIEWQKQCAMLPTPLLLDSGILRVYVGFCDENMIGRIGYVDVEANNPSKILSISKEPVLDIGENGCFDDNGVVPISILRKGKEIYLYYIGFQLGVKVPYYMFCGLAISKDNGESFTRYSKSPILDRIHDEVYARCGVNVIKDKDRFRMWYVASHKQGWTMAQGKLKPYYIMKTTESNDGIHWNNESIVCLQYKNDDEHGFGRPFVWKEQDKYKMYYSIRTYSRGYYIGYAESDDGIHWDRQDSKAGIELSQTGWDSENLSYPYLINAAGGGHYMLYNGNGCGKSGFGYAELKHHEMGEKGAHLLPQ